MKGGDLGELALRNLRESALRNSLTTLGIAVGVASLVAMLSLGVGLQQLASRRLSRAGLFDTVLVMPRTNVRSFGRQNRTQNAVARKDSPPLDENVRHELQNLPNVTEVYPQIRFPTEIVYDGSPYMTTVAGLPESTQESGAFDGMQGRFFSGPKADEAILQIEFAKDLSDQPYSLIGKDLMLRYAERQELGPDGAKNSSEDADDAETLAPGFSIIPREKKLKIIGVVDTQPAAGFGGIGSGRVLIPLDLAMNLRATQVTDLRDVVRDTNNKLTYANLAVRAKSPSYVESVEASVRSMGFNTFSLLDATRDLRLFFAIFDLLLGIFGSLALAVATLGIVNTLVMAILERRREIGVLKALGAADGDVKRLFFVEAGIMGLIGGILGTGFGWVIGEAVTLGTNIYLRRRDLPPAHVFSIPWWLALGAIAFAIVVSLVAGLYPASRAARLNPVEALRYE